MLPGGDRIMQLRLTFFGRKEQYVLVEGEFEVVKWFNHIRGLFFFLYLNNSINSMILSVQSNPNMLNTRQSLACLLL